MLDTNVLIHLLHPASRAEAGLTRQLLDWDRAGLIGLRIPAASAHEQGRSEQILKAELDALSLPHDRVIDGGEPSAAVFTRISAVLGKHKAGDRYDALVVCTALAWARQGYVTWLVTGDGNLLRHAVALQGLGVPPVITLRGAINRLKAEFPLTVARRYHEGLTA